MRAHTREARVAARGPRPWLYGPGWDLSLGYGLAYILSVPLLVGSTMRSGASEGSLWISLLLALAFSTPHYGATLLRVYESRRERRDYAFFTVWASAVLAGLFVLGLHSVLVGSILLTTYVTWGIWHFSAQNYGIAVMYLRRRGLDVTPDVKGPLHASFAFSAALAVLAIYVVGSDLSFAAGSHDSSGTFRVLQLGVPEPVRSILHAAAISGYLASLLLATVRLRGRIRLRALGPVGLLALTQALWFSVPAIGTIAGSWDSRGAGYAFAAIWISTAHAVQYLWVSTYYAQRAGRCSHLLPYLLKCMLAGSAIAAPGLFLAPGLFGGVAIQGSAIVVLVFAMVNLHHFVLEGAIWKLTDGRVARLLIRSRTEAPAPPEPRRWRWGRAVALGVGALVLMQQLYGAWAARLVMDEDTSFGVQEAAARDLRWLGLDVPDVWLSLAVRAEADRPDLAIEYFRVAAQMYASGPPLWVLNRLATLLLDERPHDPESVDEAMQLALYVAEALGDEYPDGYETLAAAHAVRGHWKRAIAVGEWALAIAYANGDGHRAAALDQKLSGYRARAAREALRRKTPGNAITSARRP